MSDDKRKVIHVKDLVIKADNVFIEPRRSHHDPFFGRGPRDERDHRDEGVESVRHGHGRDPFLGGRRDDRDREDESSESSNQKHDDHREDDDRRPFSWI